MSNDNLHRAKRVQNDEFYTRLADVEAELSHYESYLAGMSVYLPCDDDGSAFWTYLMSNFKAFGLSRLVATHYVPGGPSYLLESPDGETIYGRPLTGDGDFFSDECQDIMSKADVVITNPPFSRLREFVTTIMDAGKDFIILAPMNAITYKCIFPHIKHGRIRLGHAGIRAMTFDTPDGEKSISCIWLTSYPIVRQCKPLELSATYDPERYPTYDNYDAIEVSRCKDIPVDYEGIMGVPITFLNYWQPEEYSLVGHVHDLSGEGGDGVDDGQFEIDGRGVYMRLLDEKPHVAFDVIGHEHDLTGDGGVGVSHGQFEVDGGAGLSGSSFRLIGCSYSYGNPGVHEDDTSWRCLIDSSSTYIRLFIRKER